MNRIIKFRAWDKENKTMLDDVCTQTDDFTDMLNETFRMWSDPEIGTLELMQFTGLLDRNGKEIYEGDIVMGNLIRHSPLATRGQIVWDGYWASFANKNDAGNTLLQEINQLEIIGNIYEGLHSGEKTDMIDIWKNNIEKQSQNPSKDIKSVKKQDEKSG